MTAYPRFYKHLARMVQTAQRFEEDLIASKRYKYVRTEGKNRIYMNIVTGNEFPVTIPELMFKK